MYMYLIDYSFTKELRAENTSKNHYYVADHRTCVFSFLVPIQHVQIAVNF